MKPSLIWRLSLAVVTLCVRLSAQTADDFEEAGVEKANQGDLDGAIADFSRAINLAPNFALAYYDRGTAKNAKGDPDGAIVDLSRAITLEPKMPGAYNNRGIARMAKGDLSGAIADFDRTITLNPDLAEPFDNRGKAKFLKGDGEGAIADYNKAIALNPAATNAHLGRGAAHQVKGDLQGALTDYNRFITLTVGSTEYARFFRHLTLRQLKQDANDDLKKQVAAWSEGWTKIIGQFLTGTMTERAFVAKAAEGDAKTAREHQCEAFYYAGMVRLLAGDRAGAKGFFEKCLATQVANFTEFVLARAELERLASAK